MAFCYKYPADKNFTFQWSRTATTYENHICFCSKPDSVRTKVAMVWNSAHFKNRSVVQFHLKKNNTLVSDPYFSSLCLWLVRQDRSKMASVPQKTWMAPKYQTMDSDDMQDQKRIVLLNPHLVCSWKKYRRTSLEITTICLERFYTFTQ